jgi:hypothetical protein
MGILRKYHAVFLMSLLLLTSCKVADERERQDETFDIRLPLRFDVPPDEKDWTVNCVVDRSQISEVKLNVQLYSNGELLSEESPDLTFTPAKQKGNAGEVLESASIDLRNKAVEDLPPGYYAQKLTLQGKYKDSSSSRPLIVQQWFHFQKETTGLKKLSLEEYSRSTDANIEAIDANGVKTNIHGGADIKGDTAIDKTKSSKALPLGRLGGERPEKEETRLDSASVKSEENEN